MNKKGFTLVEILATISILALVIVIVSTKGFGAFDTAKEKIDKMNEAAITEGIELLKVEIENCDDEISADLVNSLLNDDTNSKKCSDLDEQLESGITINLEKLIDNDFIDNDSINEGSVLEVILTRDNITKKITYEKRFIDGNNILARAILKRAKSIKENEMKNNGYAMYRDPISTPGKEISEIDEAVLATTADDYGTSYYYRGNVKDNYVDFAGMCWRIVRITGDESVKLILEDQDNDCKNADGNWDIPASNENTKSFFGTKTKRINSYTHYISDYVNTTTYNEPSALSHVLRNFQITKLNSVTNLLKTGGWCFDENLYYLNGTGTNLLLNPNVTDNLDAFGIDYYYTNKINLYYNSYIRIYKSEIPQLECSKNDLTGISNILNNFKDGTEMKVALLTSDEIVFAGGSINKNESYYLINKYQNDNTLSFWTASLSYHNHISDYGYDNAFRISSTGQISTYPVYKGANGGVVSTRPVISLIKNIEITKGNGTKNDPYVIKQ